MKTMQSEGITPRFVEIYEGRYLLECFVDLGMHGHGAMGGIRTLSYGEILDFSWATSRVTDPWELQALADMSKAYIEGMQYGSRNVRTEPIDQDLF